MNSKWIWIAAAAGPSTLWRSMQIPAKPALSGLAANRVPAGMIQGAWL